MFKNTINAILNENANTNNRKKIIRQYCIWNGKYLGVDDKPLPEFFELVSEYEKKLEYAKKNTALPDEPDYKRIMEFAAYVNERVVKGEM